MGDIHYFISHNSADGAAHAAELATVLEARGDKCWFAPRDVKPGEPYPRQIVQAICRACGSGAVLALITKNANDSAHVLQEVQLAHQKGVALVPVIFDGVKLSDDLDYFFGVRHQLRWTDAVTVAARVSAGMVPMITHPAITVPYVITDALTKMPDDVVRDGRTIAVVEDELIIRVDVCDQLVANGFRPLPFEDGASACAALTKQPVDLGIFDVQMPHMSGFELLRRVREVSDMPVIMFTAMASPVHQAEGYRLGADDYIPKPFPYDLLIERVRAVLRRMDRIRSGKGKDRLGHLVFSPERCMWRDIELNLTRAETGMLTALVDERDMIVGKLPLAVAAWGNEPDSLERVDELVDTLRMRFKKVDPKFNAIETVRRGKGYRFITERAGA